MSWKGIYGKEIPHDASSQWRNGRYFANNCSLFLELRSKTGWRWREQWHGVSTSSPLLKWAAWRTQDLAGINEGARVTWRLLALMMRHAHGKCRQHNAAIWWHCHGNFLQRDLSRRREQNTENQGVSYTCNSICVCSKIILDCVCTFGTNPCRRKHCPSTSDKRLRPQRPRIHPSPMSLAF